MLTLKILRTWLLSRGITIQMPADHGDSTVVLVHTCIWFWHAPITSNWNLTEGFLPRKLRKISVLFKVIAEVQTQWVFCFVTL